MLGTGGGAVARGLLKHLSFLVTVTLAEHLGLGWGHDPLGERKLIERLRQNRWQL